MKKSIEIANKNGAHGVVFGVLNKHKIDFKKNEELINIAKDLNLKCTFHKAFDQCQNIEKSLIAKDIKSKVELASSKEYSNYFDELVIEESEKEDHQAAIISSSST